MTALGLIIFLCLMLVGSIVAIGLTIWLAVDILKERLNKGGEDDNRDNGEGAERV